jgi:hypothetical protein
MRAILALLLLAGCAGDVEPIDGRNRVDHTVTADMVASQTSARAETLKLAENAYTGAVMAAGLTTAMADEGALEELESYELRAGDALAYLRTLSEAPDEEFLWAVYFYNQAIADLNAATEKTNATAHAH